MSAYPSGSAYEVARDRPRGHCGDRPDLRGGAGLRIRLRDAGFAEYAEAHREKSRASEEAPAIGYEDFFNLFRNPVRDAHATASFPEAGDASASVLAARLMAV